VARPLPPQSNLTRLGVAFTMKPTKAGPTTIAVFDDTCGNLIQLHQPPVD